MVIDEKQEIDVEELKKEVSDLRLELTEQKLRSEHPYIIPAILLVVGIMISISLWLPKANTAKDLVQADATNPSAQEDSGANIAKLEGIKPVTTSDHIRGSLDAKVKIVEYSDTECPFCVRFHATMKQIISEYGSDNRVAWIYRHSPIKELHSRSEKEAEALECAANLGGNDTFWKYLDTVFATTSGNDGLSPDQLPLIADEVGLDKIKFTECLDSGKMKQIVADNLQNAETIGGGGTPYSVIIAPNGTKQVINGAQPYNAVKQLVDGALKQI